MGKSPKHLQLGGALTHCFAVPSYSSQPVVAWCGRLAVVSSKSIKAIASTPTFVPGCTAHLPVETHAIHLSSVACFHTGFPWAVRCGASK